MKTQTILICLITFHFANPSIAQTIDPESEWRVNYSRIDVTRDWYYTYKYYRDFIDGDTLLNNIEYHKIYYSGYTYQGWIGYPGWYSYYDHSFHGYLREENNRWYIFYENQDMLMFDFTLETGDTLNGFLASSSPYDIIVYDVDSIIIDGDYKKQLQLSMGGLINAAYLIEGIGSTTGLFAPIYQFEFSEQLVCYARNGISLWGASTEICDLTVSVNENQENEGSCSVFPNPAKDFLILTIPDGYGEVAFTIIDIVGGIVYKNSFESPSINKINLTSCHSGIYLAISESKGLRQVVKFIINKTT
jgi:hypothetical protein